MSQAPEATIAAWRQRMEKFLGPDFERFGFLDEAEARRWTARREELFQRARRMGLKSYEDNCSHLYTGELSPGCRSCSEGSWSCLFVNGRCNRRCFYCPQDMTEHKKRPPVEASFSLVFEEVEPYVRFLRRFNYHGMSVSGGEPFLTFDKTLEFIRRTRESFGDEMYIWAYTNGSLYTREKGEQLAAAGLDELRFDISANDYDLQWVSEAVESIRIVSVEIPAIPEDQERVLELLPQLHEAGVQFLNLHQLYTTDNNCSSFADRGYTLVKGPSPAPAVLESEICALEIICHALEQRIELPINYCSTAYKVLFQGRGMRRQVAEAMARTGITPEMGTTTANGVFRQLAIRGGLVENRALANQLRREGVDAASFSLSDDGESLYIRPELLDHPALEQRHLLVTYYKYELDRDGCACSVEGQPLGEDAELAGFRRVGPLGQLELHNEIARLGFQKLFIAGWEVPRALRFLAGRTFAGARKRQQIEQFLETIHEYGRDLEYLDPRFPAYV